LGAAAVAAQGDLFAMLSLAAVLRLQLRQLLHGCCRQQLLQVVVAPGAEAIQLLLGLRRGCCMQQLLYAAAVYCLAVTMLVRVVAMRAVLSVMRVCGMHRGEGMHHILDSTCIWGHVSCAVIVDIGQ
jgi:hypothetical protein